MKRKSLPVGILVLALMVALGSLGVAYGANPWTQKAYVVGDVQTATIGVAFALGGAFPPNCSAALGTNTYTNDKITLTFKEAAPGKVCSLAMTLKNTGSLPVNYKTDYVSMPPTWLGLSTTDMNLDEGTLAVGGSKTGNLTMTIGDVPVNGADADWTWTITATQQQP